MLIETKSRLVCESFKCKSKGPVGSNATEALKLALAIGWTLEGKTSGHGGMDYYEKSLCPLCSPKKNTRKRK